MAHVATLTIDHTKVAADLTDFPVLILNNGDAGWAELYALATEGGGDIRVFKSDDTTELAREIVSFSVAGETGEIHVKYTGTLSSTVDTDIHIYCDGVAADYSVSATYGRNAVWSAYVAAYHLQSSSVDSKGSYDGTDTSISYSASKIKNGASFDASTDRISTGSNTAFQFGEADSFTIQLWANSSNRDFGRWMFGRQDGAGTDGYRGYSLYMKDTSGGVQWDMYSDLGGGGANVRTWASVFGATSTDYLIHLVSTGTSSATGIDLYRNGSLQTATTGTNTLSGSTAITRNFNIGNRDGSNLGWRGLIDEFRVRASALSTSWMTTEYNNQNSPTTFYSVAAVAGGTPQALTAGADASATIAVKKTFKLTLTAGADAGATIDIRKTMKRTLTALSDAQATITSANLRFLTMTANVIGSSTIATESINAVLLTANAAVAASITLKQTIKRTLTASIDAGATIAPQSVKLVALTAAIRASASMQSVKTFYQTLTASLQTESTVTRGNIVRIVVLNAILSVKGSLGEYFYKRKYEGEDEDYKRKY